MFRLDYNIKTRDNVFTYTKQPDFGTEVNSLHPFEEEGVSLKMEGMLIKTRNNTKCL